MTKAPKSMMRLRHKKSERGVDLYETPPCATEALLKAERLPKLIWEPNCGRGAIVRVLRAAGHAVLSTDLVDYDSPDQDYSGVDFVKTLTNLPVVDAIVMNPPFGHAMACVERAIEYAPKVYALLRLGFLESERRHQFFKDGHLSRVHVFSQRLPMMHRDGWKGPRTSSTVAYAWFVFDREYEGYPHLDWIMWS